MYEADNLDILDITYLPVAEIDGARQRRAGEYALVPTLCTLMVQFDTSRPPFDAPRIRRAFALAADKETLVDMIMDGWASPATGGFIPPGMPGHSAGISLPYDPERARQLLAEAGYPGGRGFPIVDLLIPSGPLVPLICEYLQAQWRENLGVEITWEGIRGWATLLDRLHREPPHMFGMGWEADYPDPDNFLRVGMNPIQLYTHWRNEAYERLVEAARRMMDQGERIELYGQADRILVEEAAIMPLFYARQHLLVKPWVSKHPTSAIGGWSWKDVVIEPHQ
jgi:oligopeptide transport system substrate-binding protein